VRIADRAAAILAPLQLGQKYKLVGYCAESVLLLSAIARELCNCGQRIIRLRKSKMYLSGLCMDSDYHSVPGVFPRPCIRMRACIQGIQSLYTSRPWTTVLDAEIFAQGWKQGAASPGCSLCSGTHATHALHTPPQHVYGPAPVSIHAPAWDATLVKGLSGACPKDLLLLSQIPLPVGILELRTRVPAQCCCRILC